MLFCANCRCLTKCIVTTRHRIDVAYPIRLQALPRKDALNPIAQECEKKGVTFKAAEADRLYTSDRRRAVGAGVEYRARWASARTSRRCCAASAMPRATSPAIVSRARWTLIRDRPAYRLLLALAIFDSDASRQALGVIADLSSG